MKKKMYLMLLVTSLLMSALICPAYSQTGNKAEYEWKYGSIMSKVHPLTQGAQVFADEMAKLTKGRVHMTVYPSMQLGNVQEMIEGVQLGSIQFIDTAMANLAGYNDKFFAYNLPYLFYEPEVAYAFLDGPVGQRMMGPVGTTGFSVVGFYENGFRNITSNKGPIIKPADIKGQKIRTMSNKIHLKAFELAGASPTPMAFSELFSALQQGVVDGEENPLTNIKDMAFHEVQKYLTVSGHFYDVNTVLVNQKMYDSLPADIKDAIKKAMITSTKEHRRLTIQANKDILDFFKKNGKMKDITTLTPEQKNLWKKSMQGTYDAFRNQIGVDYLNEVTKETDRLHQLFYSGKLNTKNLY
jgi:TRAP-type transport system periplasmic protein